MKRAMRLISFAGLGLMLGGALARFGDHLTVAGYERLEIAGTIIWFATVPFWMRRRLHHTEE